MGTLFGFSPRMRYDLVVNTFVKDAIQKGLIALHYGGEMWRPLADVRDAARAYLALLQADAEKINGQVFNVVYRNFRIGELALRVRKTLGECGVNCDIRPDYAYRGVRNYRVSGKKLQRALDFDPTVSIEESVRTMIESIHRHKYTDFDNPRYYNIRWMQLLEEAQRAVAVTGSVFGIKGRPL
jgi:nucleoside-diphosphate-sugar epimerase